MTDAVLWHRIQFVFTITYHYLFPQLTMGLALLIVVFKSLALWLRDESYNEVARFWGRIFALNFAMGVVTGIPMEFQFGTNWSTFSRFSGEVVGQALAIEGRFRVLPRVGVPGAVPLRREAARPEGAPRGGRRAGAGLVAVGLLHHRRQRLHAAPGRLPAGRGRGATPGEFPGVRLQPLGALAIRPQHDGLARHGVVRRGRRGGLLVAHGPARPARRRSACAWGSSRGWSPAMLVAFPAGDGAGKMVARHQPVTLAAMEGLFEGGPYAELAIIGQPNVAARKLENPIVVPWILSFLCYGSFGSTVHGLNDFPQDQWPHNVELLYYSYHIMVGLGTLFILMMGIAAFLLLAGTAGDDTPHALGADAGVPVPLHRDDRRLVDRRAGTPAVGHPWPDAHGRRPLETGQPGRCGLHRAGLRRPVLAARHALRHPGPQRNQPRPGRVALGHRPWKQSGSRSSRACSPSTRCSTASTSGSAPSTASSPGPIEERRTVLAAIGPIWDGNEVWLIAAGGVLFMAFPNVYATAFSGFYMALMVVLWLLILRGVAIEFRSHQDHPLWREFWDTVFSLASALLAVVFGTTLGNLIRGVPLGKEGLRGMPLFTNFLIGREPGILDWYTGARRPLHARRPWRSTAPCTSRGGRPGPCGSVAWPSPARRGRPRSSCGSPPRPPPHGCGPRSSPASPLVPGPSPFVAVAIAGAWGAFRFPRRGRDLAAFLSSSAFLLGMLAATLAGQYPFWLRSTLDPSYSLTALNSASDHYGLRVALTWWPVGIALVAVYFTFLFRWMRGKVGVESGPSYGSAIAGRVDSPGQRV